MAFRVREFQPLRGRLPADQRTDQRGGIAELTAQDSHAWCEVYLDGLGWIPVDVTPGCYYDTFALLQMAEQPQDIEDGSLKDSEDRASCWTISLPNQPKPQTPLPRQSAVFLEQSAFVLFCSVLADRAGSPASAADKAAGGGVGKTLRRGMKYCAR